MLASTSTASTALLSSPSNVTHEGLKHLYRTILQQARLLSSTLDDPIVYTSHRFLARNNLEPLVSHPNTRSLLELRSEWPPSTQVKRWRRAQAHRRHLADANFGWPHSVTRALSVAYARTGKLRRDVLTDLTCPTTRSSPLQQARSRTEKAFSPVLQTLLLSAPSMNGATVKSREHLTGRPPPPFLPALDDPLVKYFGKATSRTRVDNARRRFVKAYLKKVLLPVDVVEVSDGEGAKAKGSLFAHLESKASRSGSADQKNIPHQSRQQPYLRSARASIDRYRSDFTTIAHRSRALRMQGWASRPKDYTRPRVQRRLYARLLDDTPLLLVESHIRPESAEEEQRKNDPLGLRAKTTRVSPENGVKLKVVRSRLAVGPRMRGADVAPRGLFGEVGSDKDSQGRMDASEVMFLIQQGLL